MARNAEGEFELILGNKQLLSLFFLVVVLFSVFFSLGYMVGKSVSPVPTLAAQPAAGGSEASPPASPPEPVREPLREPPASRPVDRPPAAESPTPAAAEPVAASSSTSTKDARPAAPAVVAREMHLQLAAVRVRDDAEVMVQNLKKKGYPVLLNSDTRDGWYRVLVGPFADQRAALEMKAMLERDGFKSILKKP
jgi:DedD protein